MLEVLPPILIYTADPVVIANHSTYVASVKVAKYVLLMINSIIVCIIIAGDSSRTYEATVIISVTSINPPFTRFESP